MANKRDTGTFSRAPGDRASMTNDGYHHAVSPLVPELTRKCFLRLHGSGDPLDPLWDHDRRSTLPSSVERPPVAGFRFLWSTRWVYGFPSIFTQMFRVYPRTLTIVVKIARLWTGKEYR